MIISNNEFMPTSPILLLHKFKRFNEFNFKFKGIPKISACLLVLVILGLNVFDHNSASLLRH